MDQAVLPLLLQVHCAPPMVLETALLVLLYLILQHSRKSFFATVPVFRSVFKKLRFSRRSSGVCCTVRCTFVVLYVVHLLRFQRPNIKPERRSEHTVSGMEIQYGALCTFELSSHWYRCILTLTSQVCSSMQFLNFRQLHLPVPGLMC